MLCEFLVSETVPSILNSKNLKRFKIEFYLLVAKENSDALLKYLTSGCTKCRRRMRIQPIQLHEQCDPVYLKRRIIPCGLGETVHMTLNGACTRRMTEPIQSSSWSIPIVTPLKSDSKTPRICSDCKLILNSRLLKRT
ncbi:hypothetical protein MS3_00002194 [Schistosoma haematobium]|uniref:Uncharacterized protein n=1 Tax=Schistosoma haematobium TaxID=6185 RepID=A0A922LZE1_SCHHA|nr:hypothetical protein MS3_00002194 [Schistosoma haematobium]KAH9596550.1 hypothetical protein MS3_00002194 [Schistosoma haematobium]